jgi:hypothetical protein
MKHLGVTFTSNSYERIPLSANMKGLANVTRNLGAMPRGRKLALLSQYLMHTSLIEPHLRGKRLEMCEGTLEDIASKFKLDREHLDKRVKEMCAICHDGMDKATVTPCGHVYCGDCVKQLQRRSISSCPLCRASLRGFMRLSDTTTEGKIIMHRGHAYRVPTHEEFGAKFGLLAKHADATFITKYPKVKSLLKQHFKNPILTINALDNGVRPSTDKIVFVEPAPVRLDYAWGKSKHVITLFYQIDI